MKVLEIGTIKRVVSLGFCTWGAVFALGGCVSYTNVPAPESAPAFKSVNHTQSISVLARALERVIIEHPVQGAYLINLPVGTTPESFEKIIAQLPGGATMPYEGMSDDFPVYHIGRVWIRASDAKVDVIYPFKGYDGLVSDQNVTVWLNGGVRVWRTHRLQHWTAGTIPTPPIYVPIVQEEEPTQEPVQEQVEQSIQEPIQESAQEPVQRSTPESPELPPEYILVEPNGQLGELGEDD